MRLSLNTTGFYSAAHPRVNRSDPPDPSDSRISNHRRRMRFHSRSRSGGAGPHLFTRSHRPLGHGCSHFDCADSGSDDTAARRHRVGRIDVSIDTVETCDNNTALALSLAPALRFPGSVTGRVSNPSREWLVRFLHHDRPCRGWIGHVHPRRPHANEEKLSMTTTTKTKKAVRELKRLRTAASKKKVAEGHRCCRCCRCY